jgi:hypothetical protein
MPDCDWDLQIRKPVGTPSRPYFAAAFPTLTAVVLSAASFLMRILTPGPVGSDVEASSQHPSSQEQVAGSFVSGAVALK